MIAPAYGPGDKVRINFWMDHTHAHHGEIGTVKGFDLVKDEGTEFLVYALEGDMGDPDHGAGFLESELERVE